MKNYIKPEIKATVVETEAVMAAMSLDSKEPTPSDPWNSGASKNHKPGSLWDETWDSDDDDDDNN